MLTLTRTVESWCFRQIKYPVGDWLVVLLAALLITGCVAPIEVKTERDAGQLVIDGFITDGQGPHKVRLSRTSNKKQLSEPVVGALVVLRDHLGQSELLQETAEGVYTHIGDNIKPVSGGAYHLEITLGSAKYATRPDTLPALVGSDTAWFRVSRRNGLQVVDVLAASTLPKSDKPLFIQWVVEEVYLFSPIDFPDPFNSIPPSCFVFAMADPQRLNLYDGRQFNATFIEQHLLAQRDVDHTFLERHFFNIYQRSLSEPAFRYWFQVDQVANQSGSIFDLPPAPVLGNGFRVGDSSEQVLGYFAAVKEDTTRFNTYRADFPDIWMDPCIYERFKPIERYPRECVNCLEQRGATYEKPPYFY